MKFKSKIITVCLATSILIIPAPKAFAAGLLHQIKEERYNCVYAEETPELSLSQYKNTKHSKTAAESHSRLVQLASNPILQLEAFLLFICIGSISMGLVLHIKDRNNPTDVLYENIEMLERAWRISNYKRK